MKTRRLWTVAPALRTDVLNERYIVAQFSATHIVIYSCFDESAVLTFNAEKPLTAFNCALSGISGQSMIALFVGYGDGVCERITAHIPDSATPSNSFFDFSAVASVKSRDTVYTFQSAVSAMAPVDGGGFMVLMDLNGACVRCQITADSASNAKAVDVLFPPGHLHANVCWCSVVPWPDLSPLPVWCEGRHRLPAEGTRRHAVLTASRDGHTDQFFVGSAGEVVGVSEVSSLPRLPAPIAAVVLVRAAARGTSTLAAADDGKFIVVDIWGFLRVMTYSGSVVSVGSIAGHEFRIFDDAEEGAVRRVELWRLRFLVVLHRHSVYVSDLSCLSSPGSQQALPPVKFTLLTGSVMVASVSLADDVFVFGLGDGTIMHCALPSQPSEDAESQEHFNKDLIYAISRHFTMELPQSAPSGDVHQEAVLRERRLLQAAVAREAELQEHRSRMDDDIRAFVALNRLLQRGEGSSDPFHILVNAGSVSARLETLKFSDAGNVNVVVSISSRDADFMEALNGRSTSFSLLKLGLAAGAHPVQSYACQLRFMRSEADAELATAEVVFPAELDSACPLVLDVDTEVSMLVGGQQTSVEIANMASSVASSHNEESSYAGFVLPVGSVKFYSSDVLAAVPSAPSQLSAAVNEELLKHIRTVDGKLSLGVEVPVLSAEISQSVVNSIAQKFKHNARDLLAPVSFRRPARPAPRQDTHVRPKLGVAPIVESTPVKESQKSESGCSGVERLTLRKSTAVDVMVSHSTELLEGIASDLSALGWVESNFLDTLKSSQETEGYAMFALPLDLVQVAAELSFLLCELRSIEKELFEAVSLKSSSVETEDIEIRDDSKKRIFECSYRICALYFEIRNSCTSAN